MKISMILDDGMLNRLDSYCKEAGITRTHAVTTAVNQMLKQDALMTAITKYMTLIGEFTVQGTDLTDDQKALLEYFQDVIEEVKI